MHAREVLNSGDIQKEDHDEILKVLEETRKRTPDNTNKGIDRIQPKASMDQKGEV